MKISHHALVHRQRGVGPKLDERILPEAQVLQLQVALPKAQLSWMNGQRGVSVRGRKGGMGGREGGAMRA